VKKLIAVMLAATLVLGISVVTHLASLITPPEEPTLLLAQFVPQYDPPPPRKPKK
jgi:hypothetical protein